MYEGLWTEGGLGGAVIGPCKRRDRYCKAKGYTA